MRKNDPLYVNLTPELIEEAQRRLDFIAREGSVVNGVDETIDTRVKPDWYDEERFRRGQQLLQKHFTAMVNISIAGLLVFLQLPLGLAPLLATGNSKNLARLFNRYFVTLEFFDEWLTSDPFDPSSKAFQTLSMVRTMHKNVNKMMNQKISVFEFAKKVLKEQDPNIDEATIEQYVRHKDRVWVSMFDMAVVQWGVLGCAILEPRGGGFHGLTKQEMEDILYMWKVLSYKLAITGKFSIFEDVRYEKVYALCKLILEQEYILHMENFASPTGIRMTEGAITIFQDILVGSNCNVYLRYWYKLLNVNSRILNREGYEGDQLKLFKISKKNQLTDEERQMMLKNGFNDKYIVTDPSVPFEPFQLRGFKERFLYRCYLIVVNTVLRYDLGKSLSRKFLKNAIVKTRARRKEKMMELEKQESPRMQFTCPFIGGVNMQLDPAIYDVFNKDKVKTGE